MCKSRLAFGISFSCCWFNRNNLNRVTEHRRLPCSSKQSQIRSPRAKFCFQGWGFDNLAGHLVQRSAASSVKFFSSFLIRVSHAATPRRVPLAVTPQEESGSIFFTRPFASWKQQQCPPAAEPACFSQLLWVLCSRPLTTSNGLCWPRNWWQKASGFSLVGGDNRSLAPLAPALPPQLQGHAAGSSPASPPPHQSPNILFHEAVFCPAPAFPAASQALRLRLPFLTSRGPCQPVSPALSLTAALPSTVAAPTPCLQGTLSFLRFFFPLSLVKTLNSVAPGVDPRGMLLVTSHCWTLHCWSQPFQHSSLAGSGKEWWY